MPRSERSYQPSVSMLLPRFGILAASILFAFLALGLVLFSVRAQPGQMEPTGAPAYAPDTLLVGLKAGSKLAPVLANLSAAETTGAGSVAGGILDGEALFPESRLASAAGVVSAPAQKLTRIYRLRLEKGTDVMKSIDLLKRDPGVDFAEPDYQAHAVAIPNDPSFPDQWGLAKIHAPAAWDVTKGDSGVVIAVLDSGIDLSHQDLADQLWNNPQEIPGNGQDDDQDGLVDDVHGWNFLSSNSDLSDDNGHGTQVAGVAGAATNNGLGVAGTCWDCRLMVVKVMQSTGIVNYSDIATGIAYAAGKGARVINLSLGGYADSETLRTAIESAATTAVIVAGAGNDNRSDPFYPAAYPQVIAVAATDQNDVKADFSNYGDWVDLAAPGVAIKTTFAGNNAYGEENGTSLSAPFVAGTAGLLDSQHVDWSPALVRQQLLNTAASLDAANPGYQGLLGSGRLDAGAALSTSPQPRLALASWALDGQAAARPAPGQSYNLVLTLENSWLPARALTGILSESDAYVTVSDASGAFGDINTGQSGANSADPFRISLAANTPYNHPISFHLQLSGTDGYTFSLDFTLTVRSGVENIPGGTQYASNTTWTKDKTYMLQGNLIVKPGVTLTVQPGTQVFVKPGSWIRIDGTLVADGTVSEPILFTTSSITNTQWAGIRFTDTSGAAVFDADGNYQAGSILRYVELSYAQTGVSMLSRAPFIANSRFAYNGYSPDPMMFYGMAISTGSSSPRIVENAFENNGEGIEISGGAPQILQNSFTGHSGHVLYGSGAPAIISNTLTQNDGDAINLGCCSSNNPQLRGNVITDNGAGVYLDSLQQVNIEHNLIANNRGDGLDASVDPSSISQQPQALIYNPDLDEYLLIWKDEGNSGLYFQSILADGEASGASVFLANGDLARLAYNRDRQEYLLAWVYSNQLLVQALDEHGRLLGAPKTVLQGISLTNLGLVYQSAQHNYLVAWQDITSSPSKAYARRLDVDGSLLGEPIWLASNLNNIQLGDVAYDPQQDQSLVVLKGDFYPLNWYGYSWGVWVTPAVTQTLLAAPLAAPSDAWSFANPDLAYSQITGDYYLSWDDSSAAPGSHIFGLLITQTITSTPTISNPASLAPGAYTTIFTAANAGPHEPRLAPSGGGGFIDFWMDANTPYPSRILGQRVGAGGELAGGQILAAHIPDQSGWVNAAGPMVAYNSQQDEYLLAWADNRQGNLTIFGRRLDASGNLLDNHWSPADESDPAVAPPLMEAHGVRFNTIIHNQGYGLKISGSAAGQVLIGHNNWFGNGAYDVYMNATHGVTVTVADNYWGEVSSSTIPARIYDCDDTEFGCGSSQTGIGLVQWQPPLAAPDQVAPAYVRSVSVSPDPVGIERATFDVNFSRPMITGTLPALSFHDARRGTLEDIAQMKDIHVEAMAEDSLGRMWFSGEKNDMNITPVGVYRYDGKDWVNFTTANSGLANDSILAIFGASNGDVWFGGWTTSRLQGDHWITYTAETTGVNANIFGEDLQGKIWLGGMDGVSSFDGVHWKHYTQQDGLAGNNVYRIARDGQGRMWFATDQGLSVFDGATWKTYDNSNGMLTNQVTVLFGDSQGRIWVGFGWIQNQQDFLGMFDGSQWTYYGPDNTNGLVNCSISEIAEDPQGNLLFSSCGVTLQFAGQDWTSFKYNNQSFWAMAPVFHYDTMGSLWLTDEGLLKVLWGGLEYPVVDNMEWLSPTHLRATYDFTPIVPQGEYVVRFSGASGLDHMPVAADESGQFTVAYAGYVSDDSPPSRPAVIALNDGSLTTIAIQWSSSDPQGIAQYRYALGTTPGGRDVLDWKYVPAGTTSLTLNGLLLTKGQTYYASVAAQNLSGLWSQVGVSNPVVAGTKTVINRKVFLPLAVRR